MSLPICAQCQYSEHVQRSIEYSYGWMGWAGTGGSSGKDEEIGGKGRNTETDKKLKIILGVVWKPNIV